jgi:hypothetical protein
MKRRKKGLWKSTTLPEKDLRQSTGSFQKGLWKSTRCQRRNLCWNEELIAPCRIDVQFHLDDCSLPPQARKLLRAPAGASAEPPADKSDRRAARLSQESPP